MVYGRDENPADLLTKVICDGKSRYIVNKILLGMYDGEFKPYAVAKKASIRKPSSRSHDT